MMLENLQDYLAENRARLLPLLLFLLIMGGMAYLFVTKVIPAWQDFQTVSVALEQRQNELEIRDAEASMDNRNVLVAQIENVQSVLSTMAHGMLTEVQAQAILGQLYVYADASGVEITNLQLLTLEPTNASASPNSYHVQSFRLDLSGQTEALLDFIGRLNEAHLDTLTLSNVNLNNSPTGAVLSLILSIYASPYADGTALENLVLPEISAEVTAIPLEPETEVTAVPEFSPSATRSPDSNPYINVEDPLLLLQAVRIDLERLTETQYGSERPLGWSGVNDTGNPQFAMLIRLDLEILAGNVLGETVRPNNWIGAVQGTLLAIAQDSRHDLELLADAMLQGRRPADWLGANPLLACNRSTITLVQFLQNSTDFVLDDSALGADFCQIAETTATDYVYSHAIDTAVLATAPSSSDSLGYYINSPFAVAFNNRFAELQLGLMPENTGILPIGRSYAEFSNMMLIRGGNFEVFIDYHFSSVSRSEFLALPDINSLDINIGCLMYWCVASSD